MRSSIKAMEETKNGSYETRRIFGCVSIVWASIHTSYTWSSLACNATHWYNLGYITSDGYYSRTRSYQHGRKNACDDCERSACCGKRSVCNATLGWKLLDSFPGRHYSIYRADFRDNGTAGNLGFTEVGRTELMANLKSKLPSLTGFGLRNEGEEI